MTSWRHGQGSSLSNGRTLASYWTRRPLEEQRIILQHLVEVAELRMVDRDRKRGTYVLKLFPEIGPLLDVERANHQ